MVYQELINFAPTFLLAMFRVAGMVAFAPVLGSGRLPRQLKVLLAAAITLGLLPTIGKTVALPQTTLELVIGLAGELMFGAAMGLAANAVFIAARWGGEMIGQQLGLGLGEMFDPQLGGHGSPMADCYALFASVIFLSVNGHHALLRGLGASFQALPLLSVGINAQVFALIVGLLQSATILAIQLAAPIFVTMLIVDLALGVMSRTVPQLNAMSAGMAIRSCVGIGVVLLAAGLTARVLGAVMLQYVKIVETAMSRATGL